MTSCIIMEYFFYGDDKTMMMRQHIIYYNNAIFILTAKRKFLGMYLRTSMAALTFLFDDDHHGQHIVVIMVKMLSFLHKCSTDSELKSSSIFSSLFCTFRLSFAVEFVFS